MMRRSVLLSSNTLISTRRKFGLGVESTSSSHRRRNSPCRQSKVRLPKAGHSRARRICTRRFSADHVAIIDERRSLLFCVRLPTARRLAPRAVPIITSATSTSSNVKPDALYRRDKLDMFYCTVKLPMPSALMTAWARPAARVRVKGLSTGSRPNTTFTGYASFEVGGLIESVTGAR